MQLYAAAISVSMISAMPVCAAHDYESDPYDYEVSAGKHVLQSDMPMYTAKLVQYVLTNSYHGRCTIGETYVVSCDKKKKAQAQSKILEKYCSDRDGNYYTMTCHQAMAKSGGKEAATRYLPPTRNYEPITTGTVKVKNGQVKIEAYYRFKKN